MERGTHVASLPVSTRTFPSSFVWPRRVWLSIRIVVRKVPIPDIVTSSSNLAASLLKQLNQKNAIRAHPQPLAPFSGHRIPAVDKKLPLAYNVGIVADTLGAFEQAVMLAIIRLGDGAYGRAILREVQDRMKRDVAAGAVHATLDRLERKGLVSSCLEKGTEIRSGRARRFYRLRAAGVRALNDAREVVDTLWHGLRWPLKPAGY